jgi:site-specific DNA recombinase
LFGPQQREQTIEALHSAGEDPATMARRPAMSQKLSTCDDRLAKYRAALEAGTDPAIVSGWIAEVAAERARYKIELARAEGQTRLTRDQIATIVDHLASLTKLLGDADPADRTEVYRQLGLRLTYQNEKAWS